MEQHKDSNNGSNKSNDMWDWPGEECCLTRDPPNDFSNLLWDGMDQGEDGLLQFLGDQTPIKDCDFNEKDYQEECKDPPPSFMVKRRKVLQFTPESTEIEAINTQITSSTIGSTGTQSSFNENGLSDNNLRWSSNSISSYTDNATCALNKSWNEKCYSEKTANYSSDETSCSRSCVVSSDDQVVVSGDVETEVVQESTKLATLTIFKGKKSVMKAPKKVATSVAYPFTIIKPFEEQGNATLKDINRKIHTPPPQKKKLLKIGNSAYPISQFSGKPVIGTKKISTEKGSITILRTKG